MSIISSRPLTKLKQQAQHNQRSLKVRQQEYQQKQMMFKHEMATKIQKCWRKYILEKQLFQQQLIFKLLININKISNEVSSDQRHLSDVSSQLQNLEDNYEQLVSKTKLKQIQRMMGVFKKSFNSGIQNEIELSYVEGQLKIVRNNCEQTQKILDDLIQCNLVLERQEVEIKENDQQSLQKIKKLEEMIIYQNMQINQLEYEQQQLMALKRKRECQNRFKQYIN